MRYALTIIAAITLAGCDSKPAPAAAPEHKDDHKHGEKAPATTNKVTDPVCKMSIDKGALKAEHDNADFYFCAQNCLDKFKAAPGTYVKACPCTAVMPGCKCGHCSGTREPCDCH